MSIDTPAAIGAAPGRRRRFTIRALMAAVVGVAAVLGWVVGIPRCKSRVVAVQGGLDRWVDGMIGGPGISSTEWRQEVRTTPWGGSWGEWRGTITTRAGKTIAMTARIRCTPIGDFLGLTVTEGEKSIGRPIDAGGPTRPVDLRAEFPGAFR